MINRLKYAIISSLLLMPAALYADSRSAACEAVGAKIQPDGSCATMAKPLFGGGSLFEAISNTLIFVVGAAAVIMVIIGGLRYVLSGGDASSVKGAKDTILYALIGIVVAALAYALVRFVVTRV